MKIIPYNQGLKHVSGCFLLPDNTLIHASTQHEIHAQSILNNTGFSEKYDLNFNAVGQSLKFNENELDLFKKYLKFIKESNQYLDVYSNFLVQVLEFDRMRLNTTNTIVTANSNPYTKFYNYFLMEHEIQQIPKLILKNDKFDYFYEIEEKEFEVYEELQLKKKMIRYNQRYQYFKENE